MSKITLEQVMTALNRADFLVPRTQEHDDAMEDVWNLVDEYNAAHV